MSSVRVLLVWAIVAVFCETALSIKCYRCESDNVEGCGEHFNSDGVLLDDCSNPPRHLVHILGPYRNATGCAKVLAERRGTQVIIRSCYFGDLSNTDRGCTHNPAELDTLYKSCEVCSESACNGSSITGPIAILVLISTVLARLVVK